MNQDKIIIILLIIIVAFLVAGMLLFNPFKTQSMLSITSGNELNEGDDFSIVLSDANSKPIPNQNVQIFLRDSNGVLSQKSVTTNNEGVGVISLAGLASGQYSVNVTYNGNSSFKPSSAFQNLNIKQTVAEHVSGTDSTSSIHPGFTPSYRDGNLIYGYKGSRWGFVTPSGMFHEIK